MLLGLLAEEPAHGFALAKGLSNDSDLGRILTVRRPLVYRALDRLVARGWAQPHQVEPGDAGPNRTLHRITPAGRRRLRRWLDLPVVHVRDLRIEFLVKLRLTERAGRDPAPLVVAQRTALEQTLAGLSEAEPDADVVDRWRRHNAVAVRAFLDELSALARA